MLVNCSSANDHACFQADVMYEKGSSKVLSFQKGCLQKNDCEAYNKGEIPGCLSLKADGYDVDCKAMCCHEDECNKENLLAQSKGSVLIVLCCRCLLLTLNCQHHQ